MANNDKNNWIQNLNKKFITQNGQDVCHFCQLQLTVQTLQINDR